MSTVKKDYPEIWTYIVRACSSADQLTCRVPLKINSDYIFFGPCMKNYRKELFSKYLKSEMLNKRDVNEDIYFLGMSSSKVKHAKRDDIRKILWFGKLISVLTFEQMYFYIDSIKDEKLKNDFKKMRDLKNSPLHIQPIINDNECKGYELRTLYHSGNWFRDITDDKNQSKLIITGNKKVELKNPKERYEIFDKDCCLLFKNIFYAEGKGLEIDKDILNIFKEHPELLPKKQTITSPYFIYGKTKNLRTPIGRQGRGLKFTDKLSLDLLDIISNKIKNLKKEFLISPKIHKSNICK